MRLTILHTNDIHGRQERIAQLATLVAREKAASDAPVVYMDAGDVEETTNRLSNLTKGTAMHRLMNHAGCDVATVGNACWLRYGPAILEEHASAARYPLLLANFDPVVGPVPSALIGDVGVLGLTASFAGYFGDGVDFGFTPLDEVAVARRLAAELRARGARLVVLLSHLGLETPEAVTDDRRIAADLQGVVDIIVGAHSHDLLPEGEWIGNVLVTQAGAHGDHLGRIELGGALPVATVEPVPDGTPLHPAVLAEAGRIEEEVGALLAETLGVLDRPLDGRWIADALRRRLDADVALVTHGQALLVDSLPPGPLTRGALWEASDSPANPGVARIGGERLAEMIARGRDPEFMASTRGPLRGRPRGFLHVSGADEIDPAREYLVAGTDWELEHYGGLVERDWNLSVRYEFPTIVREAIEEELRR